MLPGVDTVLHSEGFSWDVLLHRIQISLPTSVTMNDTLLIILSAVCGWAAQGSEPSLLRSWGEHTERDCSGASAAVGRLPQTLSIHMGLI